MKSYINAAFAAFTLAFLLDVLFPCKPVKAVIEHDSTWILNSSTGVWASSEGVTIKLPDPRTQRTGTQLFIKVSGLHGKVIY
jgi:hypothetical protein